MTQNGSTEHKCIDLPAAPDEKFNEKSRHALTKFIYK